jgi:hypothetical protein
MISNDFNETDFVIEIPGPKFFVQNRLKIQVVDGESNPVQGANVIITDNPHIQDIENPTARISAITDKDGRIPQQILTKFMVNQVNHNTAKLYFNNYAITVSKDGIDRTVQYEVKGDTSLRIRFDADITNNIIASATSESDSSSIMQQYQQNAGHATGATNATTISDGSATPTITKLDLVEGSYDTVTTVTLLTSSIRPYVNDYVAASCNIEFDDTVTIPSIPSNIYWSINGIRDTSFDGMTDILYQSNTTGEINLQCFIYDRNDNSNTKSSEIITINYVTWDDDEDNQEHNTTPETPQNLVAELDYKIGIGPSIFLSWDHVTSYDVYVVEIYDDASSSWITLDTTQSNEYTHPITRDVKTIFQVYTQLDNTNSEPITVTYTPQLAVGG